MKLHALGDFNSENIKMRMLVFLNSVFSSTLIAFVIFFFLNNGISENDVSILVSIKFWSITFLSLSIYLLNNTPIRSTFLFSGTIKVIAITVIYLEQNLFSLIIFILLNCLSGILFSIPYKLYIQQTAKNVSYEFSVRYTIHNVAAAISPLLFYLFSGLNAYLGFMFILSCLFIFCALSVNKTVKIEKSLDKFSFQYIDKTFFIFILLTYVLFCLCYLLYEQLIPTILKKTDQFDLYPIWVILNSITIALFQVKLYQVVTKRLSHQTALMVAFVICVLLSLGFLLIAENTITLFIVLIGITYLEMFFSTASDTIISSSKHSKDYFIFANLFFSLGASLSALTYSIGLNAIGGTLIFLLIALFIFYKKAFA